VKDNCPELVKSLTEVHYDDTGTHREGAEERWLGPDDPIDALKYPLLSRPSPRLYGERPKPNPNCLDVLIANHKRMVRSKRGMIGYERQPDGRVPYA
jgi:hypothetical protein